MLDGSIEDGNDEKSAQLVQTLEYLFSKGLLVHSDITNAIQRNLVLKRSLITKEI
jgi:hypothetical protein